MSDFKGNEYVSKLTLGTAQLGSHYGIANKTGLPTREDRLKIIDYAINHGINSIDTSPSYGDSEIIIGEYVKIQSGKNNTKVPSIITKIPSVCFNNFITSEERHQFVDKMVFDSLKRLNLTHLDNCLLHDPLDMIANQGEVVQYMLQLKKRKIVRKIGVSVYEPKEVEAALSLACFDIIQIPINVFDQRLIRKNLLRKLYEANIEIHGRSVFLQGLIFMSSNNLPKNMEGAKEFLESLRSLARKVKLDVMELALLYVRDLPELSKLIIGCETIKQIGKNIHIMNLPPLGEAVIREIQDLFKYVPNEIIDPRKWS